MASGARPLQWSARVGWHCFLPQRAGAFRIPLALPPGAERVVFTFRRWNAKDYDVVLGPFVHVCDGSTGRLIASTDLRAAAAGDGTDAPLEISRYPQWTVLAVQDLLKIQINGTILEALGDIEKPALLAVDFLDDKGDGHAKATQLTYSDEQQFYYSYLPVERGGFSVCFDLPRNQVLIAIALVPWRSRKVIAHSGLEVVTRQAGERFSLNVDAAADNVLVYGDSQPDPRATQMVTLAETIAAASAARVFFLAGRLPGLSEGAPAIDSINHVEVIDPLVHLGRSGSLDASEAARILAELDADAGGLDWIVVAGWEAAWRVALQPRLRGRMVAWLDDLPAEFLESREWLRILRSIGTAAGRILMPDNEMRSALLRTFPFLASKLDVLPSVHLSLYRTVEFPPDATKIVCATALAEEWRIGDLLEAFSRLHAADNSLELHVIGNEVAAAAADPDWQPAIARILTSRPGIFWHRGLSPAAASRQAAECHVAWGVLAADRGAGDPGLRMMLQWYGQLGLPVLVAGGQDCSEFLGGDYPLVLREPPGPAPLRDVLHDRAGRVLARDILATAVARNQTALMAPHCFVPLWGRRPRRGEAVLLAGRASVRMQVLASHWIADGYRVIEDAWTDLAKQDVIASREALRQAGVVICDAESGSLDWYSHNLAADQRLIVSVARNGLPAAAADIEKIHWPAVRWAVFNDAAAAQAAGTAIPPLCDRTVFIPDPVDVAPDNAVLERDRFVLGAGWLAEPAAHLRRALDLLALLRQHDRCWRR